jgi:hypothetical protein
MGFIFQWSNVQMNDLYFEGKYGVLSSSFETLNWPAIKLFFGRLEKEQFLVLRSLVMIGILTDGDIWWVSWTNGPFPL